MQRRWLDHTAGHIKIRIGEEWELVELIDWRNGVVVTSESVYPFEEAVMRLLRRYRDYYGCELSKDGNASHFYDENTLETT